VRGPDAYGRFGPFGGRYVPETLMNALIELEQAFTQCIDDAAFQGQLRTLLEEYAGRPTSLHEATRLSDALGGARIWLKREDLLHTGAHKINNALGQGLLARRMGKRAIIAETGAGQHGVASATVAALLGLTCHVYMGEEDMRRQQLNVFRMQLLGAHVVPVTSGTRTLKDAGNEALRQWVAQVEHTAYMLGSAVGPHPYPMIVRAFQRIIGKETRQQFLARCNTLPDALVACVGGGSNAIGFFDAFVDDASVQLIGVEAAGSGLDTDAHAATVSKGTPGVFQGALSLVLQDRHGQVLPAHSISAGLDYPGIGPEHAYLHHIKRAQYVAVTDDEAMHAVEVLARHEGIIAALETAHAVAYVLQCAPRMPRDAHIVLCVSGRGDKDVSTMMAYKEAHA
jgi:tryptophan synthase beta chain